MVFVKVPFLIFFLFFIIFISSTHTCLNWLNYSCICGLIPLAASSEIFHTLIEINSKSLAFPNNYDIFPQENCDLRPSAQIYHTVLYNNDTFVFIYVPLRTYTKQALPLNLRDRFHLNKRRLLMRTCRILLLNTLYIVVLFYFLFFPFGNCSISQIQQSYLCYRNTD